MTSDRPNAFRRRITCLIIGHDREWGSGVIGLTWTCRRCGGTGDLKDASTMPLAQHALYLLVTAVVAFFGWLAIRAIFSD